jgi:hypothetical protein
LPTCPVNIGYPKKPKPWTLRFAVYLQTFQMTRAATFGLSFVDGMAHP